MDNASTDKTADINSGHKQQRSLSIWNEDGHGHEHPHSRPLINDTECIFFGRIVPISISQWIITPTNFINLKSHAN